MKPDPTCLLCGWTSQADVRVSLVRWREPIDARIYDQIPRCVDRSACRERARHDGEDWLAFEDPRKVAAS